MDLAESLNDEHTRLEAAECIRELIEEIRLVPKGEILCLTVFPSVSHRVTTN
jgi:hypothetical protein